MTAGPARRARLLLAAVLLLVCGTALAGRGTPATADCAKACPAYALAAAPDLPAVPCLRDPDCGGATAPGFVAVAVLGAAVAVAPVPLTVARRTRPARRRRGRDPARPPVRPPIPA